MTNTSKNPTIVNDVLDIESYQKLLDAVVNPKRFNFAPEFSRYAVAHNEIPLFQELAEKLIPTARKVFGSETLLPTYTLFAHYEGQNPSPSLFKHKDENACTYTLDMCVYQVEPWDLWVDDKSYTLYPNQALAYYGNDQLHWREEFPNPETNHVAMIFFHFAEPDHWFFTKGHSYLQVIRGEMTEEHFNYMKAQGIF